MKIQLNPQQVAMMRQIDQQNQLKQYQQQAQDLGQQNLQQYGATNSIRPQGVIEGLATSLSGIVRRPLGMASKLVRGIGDIGTRWAQTGDLNKALAESKPIQFQETDIAGIPTLTERENVSLANTPLEFGAGNALETLAWAAGGAGGGKVPGMLGNVQAPGVISKLANMGIFQQAAPAVNALGRIGQATKLGAIGGTMGGLGEGLINPETNSDLAAIAGQGVKGGLFGGAFGGGLQTIGEIGKSIKKAFPSGEQNIASGQKMQAQSAGMKAQAEPNLVRKAQDRNSLIYKKIKENFGADAPITPENIDRLWDVASAQRDNVVRQINYNGTTDDLVKEVAPKLMKRLNIDYTDAASLVRNKQSDIFNSLTDSAEVLDAISGSYSLNSGSLHDLATSTQAGAMNWFDKYKNASVSTSAAYKASAVDSVINEYAKNVLTKNPAYKEANKVFEALYTNMPGMAEAYNAGRISLTNAGRPNIASMVQGTLERKVGEGIEGFGNLQNQLPKVNIPAAARNVLGTAGNIAKKGIPIVAPATQNQSNWTPLNDQSGVTSQLQQMQDQMNNQFMMQQEQDTQAAMPKLDRMFGQGATDMMLMLGTVGYSPQEALKYVMSNSQGASTSKPLSASNVAQLNEQKYVLDQLSGLKDVIASNQGQFNPVTGVNTLQDLGATLGLDPGREGIRTTINSLAQSVARAIEGNRVTEADMKRYEKFLPSIYDSPQVAQAKLDSVIGMLQNRYQTSLQGYQAAGYNTGQSADSIYVPESEEEYALMSNTY